MLQNIKYHLSHDSLTLRHLCDLYAVYRAGRLSKDAAAREKAALLRELTRAREREELRDRIERKTAAMWKAIEAAGNRYGIERTLENADAFVEAVYGARLKEETP